MTTFATRTREIGDLEGFDIQVLDEKREPVDLKSNGFAKYGYDRKARSSTTVSDFIKNRLQYTYPGYEFEVLKGDGLVAHGNAKLDSVRKTYEED